MRDKRNPPPDPPESAEDVALARLTERLKVRREGLDLALRELARRVDCSPALLHAVEAGTRTPHPEVASAIAAQLGLPAPLAEAWQQFCRLKRSREDVAEVAVSMLRLLELTAGDDPGASPAGGPAGGPPDHAGGHPAASPSGRVRRADRALDPTGGEGPVLSGQFGERPEAREAAGDPTPHAAEDSFRLQGDVLRSDWLPSLRHHPVQRGAPPERPMLQLRVYSLEDGLEAVVEGTAPEQAHRLQLDPLVLPRNTQPGELYALRLDGKELFRPLRRVRDLLSRGDLLVIDRSSLRKHLGRNHVWLVRHRGEVQFTRLIAKGPKALIMPGPPERPDMIELVSELSGDRKSVEVLGRVLTTIRPLD